MCGIFAGISNDIFPYLINGLKRLEYRGYDSSGLAVVKDGKFKSERAIGKFTNLEKKIIGQDFSSSIAIGHVRWATHGKVNLINTHPHGTDLVSIVHNGIIDNYLELKTYILNKNYVVESSTDTEVIAKLLDYNLRIYNDPIKASHDTVNMLIGSYSLVFMFSKYKILFGIKNKTPLIVGSGDGTFISSDAIAFPSQVKKISSLNDGDRVIVERDSYHIIDSKGVNVTRKIENSIEHHEPIKGDYPHFMLKEIYEQPELFQKILNEYKKSNILKGVDINWHEIKKIRIIGCGSAYISGLVAKYWLEENTGISVDTEIASEYLYRKSPSCITLVISQSGETLDTLEALKKAKSSGEVIIAITNILHSSIARESDYILPIMAGIEIGVASTKTFLNQLAVCALFSIYFGKEIGYISDKKYQEFNASLVSVPASLKELLNKNEEIKKIASQIKNFKNALFLGRGLLFPIALEGALKLKELSYIHAEGYSAGEIKHGPISLVDKDMLIITLTPSAGILRKKIFSNIEEVLARNGKVLNIMNGNARCNSNWCINLSEIEDFVSPMIFTIILQLLSYHVCLLRGNDADRPRNLAKSVTVE